MRFIITICMAMGLVMSGCSSEKESESTTATQTTAPSAETGMMEQATEVARNGAEAVADAAKAASDTAVDMGEKAVETAKHVASEAGDAAGKAVESAKTVAADATASKQAPAPAAAPVEKPAAAPKPESRAEVPAAAVAAAPVAAATQPATAPAPAMGDAAAGAKKIGKCKACHSLDAGGRHKVGPNLFGIYGKTAGKVAGFSKYGSDLKSASFKWDDAALAAWVCDSKSAIKSLTGNSGAKSKMPKQKICGTDALNVAAYLKTLQ